MPQSDPDYIPHPGFRAVRHGAPADRTGWSRPGCNQTIPTQHLIPPATAAALFGPDDIFVATITARHLHVTPFATIGQQPATPSLIVCLDVPIATLHPAGSVAPYLLYAIDVHRRCWSLDFRPRRGATIAPIGLAKSPCVSRIACELDGRVVTIVIACHIIVIQVRLRGNLHELWSLNPRTAAVKRLGTLELDAPLTALDPTRYAVLLARLSGELRLVLMGKQGRESALEVLPFVMNRVTAIARADGSRLVVARKGGLISKVHVLDVLPDAAVCAPSPLPSACRQLRTLLRRCGCNYKCQNDCDCPPGPGPDNPPPPDPTDPGDDEPCGERRTARLSFSVDRLHPVGSYMVAIGKAGTRMAILDRLLNIKLERKLDRSGASVHAGQRHTQKLLVHVPRRAQIEAWELDDFVRASEIRTPRSNLALAPRLQPPSTYFGRRNELADLNPTLQVCVFPVIDGGQTYGDPDMTELISQVSAKMFTMVNAYYDESSFGELAMNFTVFGHDFGAARIPVILPRGQASYFYETFRAGGLRAVMPADFTDPVLFDGTEELGLRANPRAGAIKAYDLQFAAMWSSGSIGNFPINLTFAGTEALEFTIETQDGDTHVLSLNFPATTLTVNQGGDIDSFLTDLQSLLTDVIRTAEAGITGAPTLVQDVLFRRIRTSTADTAFGLVQGLFRNTSLGDGAQQKGRISVTGPAIPASVLQMFGLDMANTVSGVMDSQAAVDAYFQQCLRATQVDADEGIGSGSTTYFNTLVDTDFDAVTQEITVEVNLTTDTGGEMATIEAISSSELRGTGWDSASPNPGSQSNPNNRNTLRDSIELADDTFTAALDHIRATTVWDRATVEALFADFDVMMIAHVGAPHPGIPLADRWACDEPADFASKRMYKRTYFAKDLDPPNGEEPVQMGTSNITGQRFNSFNNPMMVNQAGVMAHELGHAADLPDLYFANGYRDDVLYVSPWAMMGGNNTSFHHFCGWSKWKLGWIPDDPDPDVNRTIFVDLPSAAGTSVTEGWLVPIEYWDDLMRDDVRNEVGGTLPIGQLMKLNLGSDGGVTAFLELRAEGTSFSQNLSTEPTVIATNGLDPNSDRHWAVNGLYRRSVHLLNNGTELRNVNDTWDFASAPEFPIKGCVSEVKDIRTVRSTIPVYRMRVEREQAEFIDLHFQDHVPSWKSPDIWVDWPGDNPDPSMPRIYPVGSPSDQGETVRFPDSGNEKHFVVARVHNAGNVSAENVRVRWFICDPPGAGDDGRWVNRGTQTIPNVGPGANEITAFEWLVDSSSNVHQCMRMEIIDWTIPDGVDPATGDTVALASDDVKLQNNNAQQNVFDFEALGGSPFDVISFPMQVHNDRLRTEIATLVPKGLPQGSKLTVNPREHAIPSGEARVFNCLLELDDSVIRPGCDNDSRFALTAWRRDGEADEIWGSCFYYVRPRFKTMIRLVRGSWVNGFLTVYGVLEVLTDAPISLADDMPLVIRVRLFLEGGEGDTVWRTIMAQASGNFQLQTKQSGRVLVSQAWFDRTDRLGSSVSNEFKLEHFVIE